MNYELILTVVGTGVSVVGIIYMFFRNLKIDIHKQMDKMNGRMDKMNERMDRTDSRLDAHATRIDQMYRMIMDIQSEIKEIYRDWNRQRK